MRYSKKDRPLSPVRERTAVLIGLSINKAQRAWCIYMTRVFSKMKRNTQKAALIAYFTVTAIFCVYLIISSLTGRKSSFPRPQNISAPTLPKAIPPGLPLPDERSIQSQIEDFYRYRDSLRAKGGPDWEKFKQAYPQATDSTRQNEKYLPKKNQK